MSAAHNGIPGLSLPRVYFYGHRFRSGQVDRVLFDAEIPCEGGGCHNIVGGTVTLRPHGWRMFIPNGGRWEESAWRRGWQRLSEAEFRALRYAVRNQITLLEGRAS